MGDQINGWMPPLVYDRYTGASRVATQADVDLMQKKLHYLGKFFSTVHEALKEAEDSNKAAHL